MLERLHGREGGEAQNGSACTALIRKQRQLLEQERGLIGGARSVVAEEQRHENSTRM